MKQELKQTLWLAVQIPPSEARSLWRELTPCLEITLLRKELPLPQVTLSLGGSPHSDLKDDPLASKGTTLKS